jgi:hypothetical protein
MIAIDPASRRMSPVVSAAMKTISATGNVKRNNNERFAAITLRTNHNKLDARAISPARIALLGQPCD